MRSVLDSMMLSLYGQNSHFYWNMASVRAIVPGVLKEEQYSLPIADGFKTYPAEAFEFIVGSAQSVDIDAKTVQVQPDGTGDARTLSYDHLVLATGTRDVDPNMPWKGTGTHEEVAAAMARVHERVAAAKHIVVAGAGATGIETAAELRYEFKDKTVVLLSSGADVLGGDSLAASARSELAKLGVEVRTGARVAGSSTLPDGRTEIVLDAGAGKGDGDDNDNSNNNKIVTDLYLPTMGVLPNTDYLPKSLLTDGGYVDVDDHFAVKGAKDVWAAGDIVSKPKASFVLADMQVRFIIIIIIIIIIINFFYNILSSPPPPPPPPPLSPPAKRKCNTKPNR